MLYLLGYFLILSLYKKFHPDESLEGGNNFVMIQALTSLMVPCIWINPKMKLLLYVSVMTSFVHFQSLVSIFLLTTFWPMNQNHKLIEYSKQKGTFEDCSFFYFIGSFAFISLVCPLLTYLQWKIIKKHNFRSACASGDTVMIDEMLEDSKRSEKSGCLMNIFSNTVDLNEVDADSWTGFHWACWSGKAEIVQKLLNLSYCDHPGLIRVEDADVIACYYIALLEKHGSVSSLLWNHACKNDLDLVPSQEETCQRVSVLIGKYARSLGQNGKVDQFEALLDYDFIDFNCTDEVRRSGFHYACRYNQVQVVQLFLKNAKKNKIDLNAKNINGNTGYHEAYFNQHHKIVNLLIQSAEELQIDLELKTTRSCSNFIV